MRYRRIPDSDSLFRCVIYPLPFRSRGRVFAPENVLHLKYNEEKRALRGSLAWGRFVPTDEYVHEYGCRVATKMNEKLRSKGKLEKDQQRIYCGAYRLSAKAVRDLVYLDTLDEMISSSDVAHCPENGEIAHVELNISLKPGNLNVPRTITAILNRLWHGYNGYTGPMKHIADCDRDIEVHPSSLLSTPPAGPYVDTRSLVHRVWSFIRFRICNWVWHNFCQNATK